jgi:hypothetical protein
MLRQDEYFEPAALQKAFAHEAARERSETGEPEARRPYRFGLALSGGGSKSASYAMGVLEGLYANGVLQQKLEVISTVSGGGYAAYWYYSRLADGYLSNEVVQLENNEASEATRLADLLTIFSECLPKQYVGLLPSSGAGLLHGSEALRLPCPAEDDRWIDPQHASGDAWRFQNHMRGFADVLSNDFQIGLGGENLKRDVAKALGLTVATFPLHLFANMLFDWRVPLSPSQRQYQIGIERTYGLPPVVIDRECEANAHADVIDSADGCKTVRPSPNRNVGRGLTFATLDLARKRQQSEWDEPERRLQPNRNGLRPRVPLLIVNTTAGVSKGPFDWLEDDLPDFEDSVFEFTPAGFGSRLYRYWPGSHPEVDVVNAVSASAAFFDSQQRTMRWPARAAVGSLLRLFQLEWGKDIANPALPDRMRGRHAALPFPFYFAQGFTKNPQSPYIHLSDGGQSDNTGIFALVRRGTEHIVFADAAEDSKGLFKDLCTLRRKLRPKNLHLFIPSLTTNERDFARDCDAARSERRASAGPYPIWQMHSPVLLGCITRNAEDRTCEQPQPSGYFSHLYILKPSLDITPIREPVRGCRHSLHSQHEHDTLDTEACRQGYSEVTTKQPGMPRELFGFLVRNWDLPKQPANKEKLPLFPQHSTWKMTLDSSSSLYGVYKALGRWHAERLLQEKQNLCVAPHLLNVHGVPGDGPSVCPRQKALTQVDP